VSWYRRISDRRGRLRFELVGGLAAVLGTTVALALCDISPNGALVDSDVPLSVASIHSVRLKWRDRDAAVTVRVRHVTALAGERLEGRYRIGLEFLDLPFELQREFEALDHASPP
jgi:hypothetical protein